MGKLSSYLLLIRPINCSMMGFAVIVGARFSSPNFLSFWPNLTWGFITGFTLTAASMAINDYYDKEIDAVNEPSRPIPSGLINSKEALAFSFLLTIISFTTAYLTNISCFVIAIIAWFFFVVYTTVGKRSGLPGNLLVSSCISMPFIYGSYAITTKFELNNLLFVLMAFLSNTGREINKGIIDVKGDKMKNVKTLAVSYGEKYAAIVASVFYMFAVLLSPIPWILNLVSLWFIPLVIINDFGLIASSFMLVNDYSRENARKIKKLVLVSLIFGMLAFIIGYKG